MNTDQKSRFLLITGFAFFGMVVNAEYRLKFYNPSKDV